MIRLPVLAALAALLFVAPARAQGTPPRGEPDPGLFAEPPAGPDAPPPAPSSPPGPSPSPPTTRDPYPYPYPYPYTPPAAAYPPYPPATIDRPGDHPPALQLQRPKLPNSVLVSLEAGPAAHYAYHEALYAGRVSLVLGAQDIHFGGGVLLEGDFGKSATGLRFETFNIGPAFRFAVARRLGVGFGVASTFVFVHRVTVDSTMGDLRWGPWLQFTVDLLHGGSGALFLGLRGGVEYSFSDNSGAFSGALTLGYRSPARAR
jgi:hypothetical protein